MNTNHAPTVEKTLSRENTAIGKMLFMGHTSWEQFVSAFVKIKNVAMKKNKTSEDLYDDSDYYWDQDR